MSRTKQKKKIDEEVSDFVLRIQVSELFIINYGRCSFRQKNRDPYIGSFSYVSGTRVLAAMGLVVHLPP